MQFSHIIEQSPRDWETTLCQNVVLIIFHTHIYHHVWKTVRTTLQCIVGLQSQGEGHEMEKSCGTNLPGLENNGTSTDPLLPIHTVIILQ